MLFRLWSIHFVFEAFPSLKFSFSSSCPTLLQGKLAILSIRRYISYFFMSILLTFEFLFFFCCIHSSFFFLFRLSFFNHSTLNLIRAPLGFHLTHLYFFIRTRQCLPYLSVFSVEFSFLNRILNELLGVLRPSVGVIYALGCISTHSESFESVMAMDCNLIREDTPELGHPLEPSRWPCFTNLPYIIMEFHLWYPTLNLGISVDSFKFLPWSD